MQKRELKDAIEELSNNLVNRIGSVTQELLTLDKKVKGEFLQRHRFDNEFDLPRSLFASILKKMAKEFHVENKNVKDIIKKINEYLGVEDVERKGNGEPEEIDPKAN
jgi:molecular chaperone DnaK (HSP70)